MDPAATAALYSTHVLKDGDSFLVANGYGDVEEGSTGLFRDDTRLLSMFRLRLGETQPALLSAAVTADNVFFLAHMTNRQLPPLGETAPAAHGLIHLLRARFLYEERLFERITLMNYGTTAFVAPLRIEVAADFRDMFEVRGQVRAARGKLLDPEASLGPRGVVFSYEGLDKLVRKSAIAFSQPATHVDGATFEFLLQLVPGVDQSLFIEVGSEPGGPLPSRERHRDAAAKARKRMRKRGRRGAHVRSSGPLFDAWMQRSRADLALLTSELETGPYPYAGIPWFSTPFGRDAVITALQTLWLDPGIARGVLGFLAAHQAQEESSFLDSAPGKIMHETRRGEMSALRELPFGRYYGGVDTTPLFVMLAGAYARRTGDAAFVDTLVARAACGDGLDRTRVRRQPRWLPQLCARRIHRLVEPGLEGQRGLGLPCGRALPEGPDLARRSPGLCVRGVSRDGRTRRTAARRNRHAGVGGACGAHAGGGRGEVLDGGPALLRHRSGW